MKLLLLKYIKKTNLCELFDITIEVAKPGILNKLFRKTEIKSINCSRILNTAVSYDLSDGVMLFNKYKNIDRSINAILSTVNATDYVWANIDVEKMYRIKNGVLDTTYRHNPEFDMKNFADKSLELYDKRIKGKGNGSRSA